MRISPAQVLVLRLGAVACLVGAVVAAYLAVTIDSAPPDGGRAVVAADPREVPLPDPGLFGSQVIVYGASGEAGVAPSDLGCRLLSRRGTEQSTAKMSELRVLSTPAITLDGENLDPLFSVDSYPSGSVLACSGAAGIAPLAISAPSTFGTAGLVVRGAAALASLTMLGVGLGGLVALRRRR
ncbi:hypothetical protein [Nocardioides sp. SYSU DS0663]|uniref:hypothetical protein n=1 Tax=Nocardioides sp. SYSU DS0663 TaxID=3416445 RepID=UPI003F4C5F3D